MADARQFSGEHVTTPKYGENAHQHSAGLFADPSNDDPLAIHKFERQEGSPPSYNNLADVDRLLQTATHIAAGFAKNELAVPFIALGAKHGNMCGVGVSSDPLEATKKMLDGDPIAIFGGSTMLDFDLDKDVTQTLLTHNVEQGKRLLDVVVAPGVYKSVLNSMQRKGGKLRILTNPALAELDADSLDTAERVRYVRGGLLVQENYLYVPDFNSAEWRAANPDMSEQEKRDIIVAWGVGCTSTSNTITLVKDGQLIGNGVGQQDRVSAANLAISRAERSGHSTEGATAYSDSFFPFPDGPQTLMEAGIDTVFTTTGSIRDDEALAPFRKNGVAVFTAPDPQARGFYGH